MSRLGDGHIREPVTRVQALHQIPNAMWPAKQLHPLIHTSKELQH
jgi:hypothetical protein